MTSKFARLEYFRDRHFYRLVALSIEHDDLLGKSINRIFCRDDISEPEVWRQDLRKGSYIDNLRRREARHGQQWPELEVVFMIIIVLYNGEAKLRGDREQSHATFWSQNDCRRKMMVGREINGLYRLFAA